MQAYKQTSTYLAQGHQKYERITSRSHDSIFIQCHQITKIQDRYYNLPFTIFNLNLIIVCPVIIIIIERIHSCTICFYKYSAPHNACIG